MTEMSTGWMLPSEAFDWVELNINEGATILEFGSGHGSERLANRYDLWSVEHDEDWLELTNSNYVYSPIIYNETSNSVGEKGWYDPSTFSVLPPEVDLIIVDGPPGDIGRSGLLNHLDILPKARMMLIDDVDREAEANLLNQFINNGAKKHCIIDSQSLRFDGSKRAFAIILPPIIWGVSE